MTQLSSVINRLVLSRSDCCILGIVKDVFFDAKCKKIVYFVVSSEQDANPQTKRDLLFPFSEVLSFADALVVDDTTGAVTTADADISVLVKDLLNKPVFSSSGDRRGAVKEAEFDEKGKVFAVSTEYKSYMPSEFAGAGDIIILRDSAQPVKRAPRRKMPKPEKETTVRILDKPNTASEAPAALAKEATENSVSESGVSPDSVLYAESSTADITKDNSLLPDTENREPVFTREAFERITGVSIADSADEAHTPTRIICEYDFLLGRKLIADLRSYVGELLAPSGSIVTHELVESARKCGKLVELTLNSK